MGKIKNTDNRSIIVILLIGALLRISLGIVNPPNNTFDDHLEPIAYYVNHEGRPSPAACWECYQPPLYYFAAENVFKAGFFLTDSYYKAWKCVQFISVFFSIGTLLLIYQILARIFAEQKYTVKIVLAIVAIFPRDIYTAAMINNDAILVFLVTLCVWLFILYESGKSRKVLLFLCMSVVAAAFTKQHGLLTVLFPAAIAIQTLYKSKKKIITAFSTLQVLIPLFTLLICLGDEIWKYNLTKQILVSNQHFFDYTSQQLPGSLAKTEFFTFRLLSLFLHPLMGSLTICSYWTVLFAGAWFDYEWRFVAPHLPMIRLLSSSYYILGLLVLAIFIWGIINSLQRKLFWDFKKFMLFAVGVCFFMVPLIQTLRFPFFSSMKSLFFLPSLSIMALILCLGVNRIGWLQRKYSANIIITILLFTGFFHVAYIIYFLPRALPELSGPLWNFPRILF